MLLQQLLFLSYRPSGLLGHFGLLLTLVNIIMAIMVRMTWLLLFYY